MHTYTLSSVTSKLTNMLVRSMLLAGLLLSWMVATPPAARAAGPNCTVGSSGADYTTIQAAVDDGGCTTIAVAAGTYAEHVTIERDVTISGAGASKTTVDGTQSGTVFTITSSAVTLQNLTIANGTTNGFGAGILNDNGNLTVIDSTLSGNSAPDGFGAGIDNSFGTLTVSNSTFSGNSASNGVGGGIDNRFGTLTVSNSTFSDNSAFYGGAINNQGTLTVSDSTFSGNSATYGGGIDNDNTATVSNSTFSGNSATYGGAIRNNGATTLNNSTLSGNSGSYGSSIARLSGSIAVSNSIIASTSDRNCFGGISTDNGGNIASDGSCGFSAASSLNSTDPKLDPSGLKDNGGSTQTIALLPASPAINAGVAATCADAATVNNLDQRGQPRTNDPCDSGAYEFQPPDTKLNVAATSGTYGGAATLSAVLTLGGNPVPNQSVSFTLNGASVGSAFTDANGVATLNNVSLSGINVGSYSGAVAASFAGNSPFNASNGSGSLTIVKAGQAITFGALSPKPIGSGSFSLSATASSGLPVSFSSTTTSVCTVSGATVTIVGVGTCSIIASQSGNANYNAAPDVTQSFMVGYKVCLLYDPQKSAVKAGGTMVIKLYLCNANGKNLSSSAISLKALNVDGSTIPIKNSRNANPNDLFRFNTTLASDGGYIFNLTTTGLSKGQHTISFSVGSDTTNTYTASFYIK